MSAPDLSEFIALTATRKRPCQVATVKQDLDSTERDQLEAACEQPKEVIPATAIVKWLRARGRDANVQQISAHRRRECACHVGA